MIRKQWQVCEVYFLSRNLASSSLVNTPTRALVFFTFDAPCYAWRAKKRNKWSTISNVICENLVARDNSRIIICFFSPNLCIIDIKSHLAKVILVSLLDFLLSRNWNSTCIYNNIQDFIVLYILLQRLRFSVAIIHLTHYVLILI